MKLTTGLLYGFATTCQLCVASSKAYVYTIGQSSQQQPSLQPPTISASTARLLFAGRLGLSQYHSIEQADDDTIHFLNDFGGSREQIFIDENERKADQKVLVFVENVERPEGINLNPRSMLEMFSRNYLRFTGCPITIPIIFNRGSTIFLSKCTTGLRFVRSRSPPEVETWEILSF